MDEVFILKLVVGGSLVVIVVLLFLVSAFKGDRDHWKESYFSFLSLADDLEEHLAEKDDEIAKLWKLVDQVDGGSAQAEPAASAFHGGAMEREVVRWERGGR